MNSSSLPINRFKMRAAVVILTASIPGALSPVIGGEPGRAAPSVFNRCELPEVLTYQPSSVGRPHITAMSLPGNLQALPSTTPSWSYMNNVAGSNLGVTLSAGDLTGDGIDDLFVSASGYTNGEPEEGQAYVFYGSSSGLSALPDWTFESNIPEARFAYSGGIVPDVDGDGVDDLLMSSAYYSNDLHEEGVASLWSWSPSGPPCRATWVIEGNEEDAYFGYTSTSAGDVNGDGFGDMMIGWAENQAGVYTPGRAFVYKGAPNVLGSAPMWSVAGTQTGEFMGFAAAAGDVNADGFGDLLVGAPYHDNGQVDEGAVFLYMGSATGLSATPVWSAEADREGPTYFGVSLASGDVNGDGYDDMMVVAYEYSYDQNKDGAVFVYYGSASGLPASPSLVLNGSTPGLCLGASRNTLATGDVNADGFDDLLVGTSQFDHGQINEGAVFLYMGSATGLSATPAWMAESNLISSFYGKVALGDLNGDGLDDVIVGATRASVGQAAEGAVFVYLTQAPSAAAGRVPEGDPLTVQSIPGGDLQLTWGSSCLPGDSDYEIYEGLLGNFSSHVPIRCSTGGLLTQQITPSPGDRYYLVVPRNAQREGSYGLTSSGSERPASASSCVPQAVASSCPGP
ncbi:MAG TPA: FG-GAP-like repeat-containing protein [Candidatus Polarisedimenticolia bacterium]|nr:FG-GAP-like repeat-containing protein [Candidatus Polarisedimenticolia bacterium]